MKAIIYESYGAADLMKLADIPKPTAGKGEVVIKMAAASINPVDWIIRSGVMKMMTGKKFPRGIGCDVAGIVDSVGPEVSSVAPGDEVFGWIPLKTSNALAEFALVPATTVVKKTANISFEQMAALPMAAVTAYKALVGKGKLSAGKKVLINGASGGVGLFALQIAKKFDADVSGTCSAANVELVKKFGANTAIDYRTENILEQNVKYDIILEASAKLTCKAAKTIMAKKGRFLDLNATPARMIFGALSRKYYAIMTTVVREDLELLVKLVEEGTLQAHIGKQVPLESAIEVLTSLEDGNKVPGKVIVTMS